LHLGFSSDDDGKRKRYPGGDGKSRAKDQVDRRR
jgi:hypothetical protein